MCTVICRFAPDAPDPVQMLALRDELAGRAYDTPDRWWPDQPDVVGGRDRTAGGTWCASDVRTGLTAVVLNRPEKRTADAGAPSRGVLPLTATVHGDAWPERIDLAGMASFNLVLADPSGVRWWRFDGSSLTRHELPPGVHMLEPPGLADELMDARFAAAADGDLWASWRGIVEELTPSADPLALLVHIPVGDDVFETVFGQFIAARPSALSVHYTTAPASPGPWTPAEWAVRDGAVTRTG